MQAEPCQSIVVNYSSCRKFHMLFLLRIAEPFPCKNGTQLLVNGAAFLPSNDFLWSTWVKSDSCRCISVVVTVSCMSSVFERWVFVLVCACVPFAWPGQVPQKEHERSQYLQNKTTMPCQDNNIGKTAIVPQNPYTDGTSQSLPATPIPPQTGLIFIPRLTLPGCGEKISSSMSSKSERFLAGKHPGCFNSQSSSAPAK